MAAWLFPPSWRISDHVTLVLYLFVLQTIQRLCLATDSSSSESTNHRPLIDADCGPIRGLHYTVPHLNLSGDEYLGIPYAKPPVRSLRFRYPVKVDSWEIPYDASKLPNSCVQAPDEFFGLDFPGSSMWNPNTPVSEDCLYLNVWVPSTKGPGKRPKQRELAVLVWIFGGGYYSGTPTLELYDGKILASMNDIIVVSVGYRVGALGFLCLDHLSAPCNMGLFDQLMALEWIRKNIRSFGGDSENITLWGESAGSASVSLHLLSPLSRDKFHRAILQSGSANMFWATTSTAEAKMRSKELAVNYLNCDDTDDMQVLADCLRRVNASLLIEQQWVSRGILQFPFLPVIDGYFLQETPHQALRHRRFKRCPILTGSNLNEASYFLIYELSDHLTLNRNAMSRETFLSSIKSLFFHYPQYRHELNSTFLTDAIAFQYTNWLDINETLSNVLGLDGAIGDCYFVCPMNDFAMAYATTETGHVDSSLANQTLSVYSYYFTERYLSNPWPAWMGVMHGDEILFTFGNVLKKEGNFTRDEQRLSVSIMKQWTNFAKTGLVVPAFDFKNI